MPFHIGSAEIEKAAKVRKFKDFHESIRRSPIIVSTCHERAIKMHIPWLFVKPWIKNDIKCSLSEPAKQHTL